MGKATNPLLKPCENSDIYAFMIKTTKKNAVVALRTAWWRKVDCRYSLELSQSWLVASTIAGLPHYVHIINFEDVHSPVDKEVHRVNQNWLERISCPLC
ncbi:MAG: hypothetical protein Q7J06_08480 [Bacteroidales bacterium]|nr:hypothetical protein [Bacteroidales bacterium]